MKIKDFFAAGLDSLKEPFKNYKPVIKGCILVFFGLFLTRYDIGIGRLSINLILGGFAYLFLSLSFLLLYRSFLDSPEHIEKSPSRTAILFTILNFLTVTR